MKNVLLGGRDAVLRPWRWCQLTTWPLIAFLRNRHHLSIEEAGVIVFSELACCSITGQIGHQCGSNPPVTNYMFTSVPTVFKFLFLQQARAADFLPLPFRVRIVICSESGGRLLGARIPGLFFWCLLNVSVSCGGKAGDESSCVNNLWHIPH